jgi:peptide/nickel transport system permease protein
LVELELAPRLPPQETGRSPGKLAWDRLRRDRAAVIAAGSIACIALLIVLAPLIADALGHGPNQQFLATGLSPDGLPRAPNSTFLLGTDDLGRDVLVRTVYGTRLSLFVGIVSSLASIIIGGAVGLVAGYLGGHADTALSRLVDVTLAVPGLLLAIALVSLWGSSSALSIAVIVFFSVGGVARIVRGQTIALCQREFVLAARSCGAGPVRVIVRELLPNITAPVIVLFTLLVPASIVFEATLSFLGLGVIPPTATWGNMLSESLGYYQVAWWFVLAPGVALLVTTLAFNVLGDSVRDALDVRGQNAGVGRP